MGNSTPKQGSQVRGNARIRRGVALYSYQEEVFVRQMSLENCLREVSDIGARDFEFLPEMQVPNFPNPGAQWIDRWHRLIEELGLRPACYTAFIDSMRTKSHNLTVEEGVQTMLRDIRLAKDLGISRIRALRGTPISMLEATIPHLEKEDVWMGVEIHSPVPLRGRLVERLLGIAEHTDHFGFVIDLGIFQNRPNPYARDRMVRNGVLSEEEALFIENAWGEQVPQEAVIKQLKEMSAGVGATAYTGTLYRLKAEKARDLLPLMPKIRHIHGKTWGLNEDCTDPAIDLTEVIPVLIQGGYDGAIATEYEGQRYVQDVSPFSSVEMVRRYQVMLRRLLGEI